MNRPPLTHLARPAIVVLLFMTVLLLGTGPSAWATPVQAPAGQSIPTVTPGGPTIPEVTPPIGRPRSTQQLVGSGVPTTSTTSPGAVQVTPTAADRLPSAEVTSSPVGRPGSTQQVVAPGVATTITISAGAVTLPANALSAPGTVDVAPLAAVQRPLANDGYTLLGEAIEIRLYDAQGNPIAHPTFANPIQVCLDYSANDLAKAGGQAGNLVVQIYDTSTQKWVALPTAPDATAGRACAAASELGLFALAARSSIPDVLPQTGLTPSEQTTQPSNATFWRIIVVFLTALVALIVLVFRSRRTRQS